MDPHEYSRPHLNTPGIVYSVFIVLYTVFIIGGLLLLSRFRKHTEIRIRSFNLIVISVLALHTYVAALFIVYPLSGAWTCGEEFWYMSLVLPGSIAIFQASNLRLHGVVKFQKRLSQYQGFTDGDEEQTGHKSRRFMKWWQSLDFILKVYVAIAVGFIIQIAVTFFLYYGSRRFSPSTGFFGHHVDDTMCRTGYEWIPSVIWQFLWTAGFAPLMLFKTRKVRDCHLWAIQTRIAGIASIPGTPLWLLFLYCYGNSTIAKMNHYWPPAMWFSPGLIAMQLTSLICPYIDIRRAASLARPSSSSSIHSKTSTISYISLEAGGKRYADAAPNLLSQRLGSSFAAFEACLEHCIEPLKSFATEQDFTVESIIFLERIQQFRRSWAHRPPCFDTVNDDTLEMYEDGSKIFYENVNPATSNAPINVPQKIVRDLYQVFAEDDNAVNTPQRQTRPISIDIFDAAENDVKRMTFHNTWKRFVRVAKVESLAQLGLYLTATPSPSTSIEPSSKGPDRVVIKVSKSCPQVDFKHGVLDYEMHAHHDAAEHKDCRHCSKNC